MNNIRSLKTKFNSIESMWLISPRTYSVGKAKKASKGVPLLISKEVKATTMVGANILKEGSNPKIVSDSEYPDWVWHLLDKRPALSELRRKEADLVYEDLKCFVKLDNRARIKENNVARAKN